MPIPGVSIVSPTIALGAADLVDRKCVNLTDLFPLAGLLPIVPQFSPSSWGGGPGEQGLLGGGLLQLGGVCCLLCEEQKTADGGKVVFLSLLAARAHIFLLFWGAFKSTFTEDGGITRYYGLMAVRVFALLGGGLTAHCGNSFQSWLNFLTNFSYLLYINA